MDSSQNGGSAVIALLPDRDAIGIASMA